MNINYEENILYKIFLHRLGNLGNQVIFAPPPLNHELARRAITIVYNYTYNHIIYNTMKSLFQFMQKNEFIIISNIL